MKWGEGMMTSSDQTAASTDQRLVKAESAVAMLQDLFVKWGRAQGYAAGTKRHTEFLDAYAVCVHAGLLPEIER